MPAPPVARLASSLIFGASRGDFKSGAAHWQANEERFPWEFSEVAVDVQASLGETDDETPNRRREARGRPRQFGARSKPKCHDRTRVRARSRRVLHGQEAGDLGGARI